MSSTPTPTPVPVRAIKTFHHPTIGHRSAGEVWTPDVTHLAAIDKLIASKHVAIADDSAAAPKPRR